MHRPDTLKFQRQQPMFPHWNFHSPTKVSDANICIE
jgi:hypothetical protein